MIHSICLKEYPPELFRDFGLVIFDECHHTASEVFSRALMKLQTKFTLGLSATPRRKDGLFHVVTKFLGALFHYEKRTGNNQVIIKQICLNSKSEYYEVVRAADGTKKTSSMITNLTKYPERNNLLATVLKLLVAQGRKILLLSGRREHLHTLSSLLDIMKPKCVDGKLATYGFYYGKQGTSESQHKLMLAESSKCDIILGTNAIAEEGLDIPDLNTLVFATPPNDDVEQAVGRILRKFHEYIYPMVVDLVDRCGNFPKQASVRNQWYREENYILQNIKMQLDNILPSEQLMTFFGKRNCEFNGGHLGDLTERPVKFSACMLDDANADTDTDTNVILTAINPSRGNLPAVAGKKKILIRKISPAISAPAAKSCLLNDEPKNKVIVSVPSLSNCLI